ncbi:MAG: extracellular solute-binding protein [Pseudomonadota bacterium]
MYGDPALPPDFVSLPYVNPNAPKGGRITLGNTGGFDSLNPFVRKGTVPWQLRFFTHQSLMGRSQDEPFSLYGLLAESIETAPDRSWVEFTLRPEGRFSDGSPVTVQDVIWSFETLGTQGHPRYLSLWNQITGIEATGPRTVRITFQPGNRELALIAGLRPILSKAQWEGRDFANAPLDAIPMGTGPYTVTDYEAGRQVTLTRVSDWWAADLPLMRGMHNFDEIRIDFYGDGNVLFEAFKAGDIDAVREFNAQDWDSQYAFARVQQGEVIKSLVPHEKPSGMTGFAMNTRRQLFADIRVRQALLQAFNFEYVNDTLTGGAQPRITSYFSGSGLAFAPGPAQGAVAEYLAAFPNTQVAAAGPTLPVSDGTERNRRNVRAALRLLADAGWQADASGVMRNADGAALAFDILLPKGDTETQAIADIYIGALRRLGIDATVETVDDAQYLARTAAFDFDMTWYRRAASLSPGSEQRFYWGSDAATQPGSRNLPGIADPAIDAMITAMLNASGTADFTAAARALDRLIMAGSYFIPFWSYTEGRIAHVRQMQRPDKVPLYGDSPTYMPGLWWWQDESR